MKEPEDYMLDGKPISWIALIRVAAEVGKFADDRFRRTSEAAKILRKTGHTVDYNRQPESINPVHSDA